MERINNYKNINFKIGPSKIQGVGLIAIKNIPKDTLLLTDDISNNKYIEFKDLTKKGIDNTTINTIKNYFAHDEKGIELPPEYKLNLIYYLNHSQNDNLYFINNKNTVKYYSNRDIESGEELLINYEKDNYSEEKNDFKDNELKTINITYFFVIIFIFFLLIICRKIK